MSRNGGRRSGTFLFLYMWRGQRRLRRGISRDSLGNWRAHPALGGASGCLCLRYADLESSGRWIGRGSVAWLGSVFGRLFRRIFRRLGLQQSIERKLTIFLLIAVTMLFRTEFASRQAFQQRQFLAAIQTPHDVADRLFLFDPREAFQRFLPSRALIHRFWVFPLRPS